MELLQLKYFLSAARSENFSKTAADFMVPQSTVSQTIKKLENELGLNLFDRIGNRVRLNNNGKIFQNAISKALNEINTACETLNEIAQGNLGTVSILIKTDRRFIAECIAEYKENNPNIKFTVHHRMPSTPTHFDIIIDDQNSNYPDLISHPLITENIFIGVNKNHKLADKKFLCFEDIKNESFISMPDNSSLYRHLHLFFEKNGQTPVIDIFCDDPFYIRKYLKLQFGIALWPEFSWKDMEKDIVLLPMKDKSLIRKVYLFTESGEVQTLAAKNFSEFLLKKAKNL